MKQLRLIITAFIATMLSASLGFAETPVLRAAVLKVGTVNWELDTIKHNALDQKNGFDLQVTGMAGNPATRIAFQGGEADVIVADWIWVARQRAEGKDFVFIPYSKAVGGLLVKKDSPIQSLSDLKGKKIGIAGGPVDKSWLLLRALAEQKGGFDLAGETEQVFGAPPLVFKSALSGEVDAAINFWHFNAKMQAAGMRQVVSVADAANELGLSSETPLLGYVVRGELVREHPELVNGLAMASRQAKEILATDDTAWDRLRPMMRAEKDSAFNALKDGFRAGIPTSYAVNEKDAATLLQVMAKFGGEKLVGKAVTLPQGVFLQPES
ncbi:ABC transporter substrate-binding protein [Amylibacter kogurei]|uniref:ABC transporter substrate-binding protein n=1 Tax=Paramylibacter kogurei TaxID=1889778 RepID=A0A2G5K511_9RHOB|nr:ABC transporter substrate-binding protein [Amylibacter kogurei]PIB24621.1 ABC transporter substrate-binding protein [Amylibacter kogurei]